MLVVTLREIEVAIRSAWSRETCDESDLADWSPANPARGQCGATALTLHDLLGGNLLVAEVHRTDGSRQGYHCWNRLAGDLEIDLTREQFSVTEVVQQAHAVERPRGLPQRGAEQYLRLRSTALTILGTPATRPTTPN